MTIGSLFAGIGGLELGLERARLGPTIWQVEQDPFCRAVLAKHWPDADRSITDVREANRTNLEPVDIMCGGFPCTDISYAGKGAGLAGERSGLWFEFARIIGELEPRYVVVENVAALATRGLADVLGTLSDLGYDATWTALRASDVGAPHRRERIFIVAYARRDGEQRRGRPFPMASSTRKTQGEGDERQRMRNASGCCGEVVGNANQPRQRQQRGGGVLDGQRETRGNDTYGCDSAADVGDAARKCSQRSRRAWDGRTEPADASERKNVMADAAILQLQGQSPTGPNSAGLYSPGRRSKHQSDGRQVKPCVGREFDGISTGLDRYRWPAGPSEAQHDWEAPRTIPPENTDGFNLGFRAARLKALGNAVVPQCAEVIGWIIQAIEPANEDDLEEK